MAIFLREDNQTFNAKTDLSTSQYLFVVLDSTTGYVSLPTAVDQFAIGILTNVPSGSANSASVVDSTYSSSLKWTTGFEQISPVVCVAGETIVQVDAAYAVGTVLMPRGDGTMNGFGTLWDGTHCGRAKTLSASSVAGDQVEVLMGNFLF